METSTLLKTALLGFGNPCRSDDAVGIYVVNELKKSLNGREDISVFDMGTSAFEILFKLTHHQRIFVIDGVINSGSEDGTLFCLQASEINSAIQEDPLLFLHGMKWDQALSYSKKILGPEFDKVEIKVYLIAVSNTKLKLELSEKVKHAGDRLVSVILNDL